jgi:Holliday junction DNA helicase RuvA
MIRSLTGTVAQCHPQWTELHLSGFGLKVFTPPLAFATGTTVTLHTYLAVRETALDLYGFCTTRELELFELLLTVPKIGPKSALQIVAGNQIDTLLTAIAEQDAALLKHGVGVGGKTGAAILTHLHQKVAHLITTRPDTTPRSSVEADAIEALISLGFAPDVAKARVRACTPTNDVTALITAALQQPQ